MFYNDCAFLEHWPGTPIGDEEGELISNALGDKRAILLAHHGQLSTGKNIEEATILAYNFEHAARLQLLAMAAGEIKELEHTPAQDVPDYQARLRISSGDEDALD